MLCGIKNANKVWDCERLNISLQVMPDHKARSKRVNDSLKTTHMEAMPNEDIVGRGVGGSAHWSNTKKDPKVSVLRPATVKGREMAWTDVKSDKRQARQAPAWLSVTTLRLGSGQCQDNANASL